jgi:uncharacterized protein YijF (DUF1287 family)
MLRANSKVFPKELAMISRRRIQLLLLLAVAISGGVVWRNTSTQSGFVARRVAAPTSTAARIVAAAKSQVGTIYNASYQTISYPNGDLSSTRIGQKQGACTDVVVRALRPAGFDLQRLIHEDMTRHFAIYPQLWDLTSPNSNIDHRRVPNQMTFFRRFGQTLPTEFNSSTRNTWQPGDIVCWDTGQGRTHTGILSDGVDKNDTPLVIHNNGICREENCLLRWKIIGHFRFPK